ncbi:GIN domain-containing protein [Terricaulis sp.]|uniref:GIN domain-containing protein n=1 Tax=Terricaulis sp. TaxID=2768686 RepID=UPI0037844CCD
MRPIEIWSSAVLVALALATAPAAHAQPVPAPRVMQTPPQAPPPRFTRYAAIEVQVVNAVAFVRVIPENRSDIALAVINSGPLAAPQVRVARGRLIIDGQLRRRVRSCRTGADGRFDVEVTRVGRLSASQIPTYELRVPQNAVVSTAGAVRLHVLRSERARVRVEGCGDADIDAVATDADIALSGSPDLRVYEANTATISVAGAGDVTVGVVRQGLTASIAGAGDLVAARVDGPTNIAVQGAGDVTIRDGRATVLSIAIAGSGDVVHNGSAQQLDAAVFGAGDIRVRRVDGQVTRRVLGVGDVVVGH